MTSAFGSAPAAPVSAFGSAPAAPVSAFGAPQPPSFAAGLGAVPPSGPSPPSMMQAHVPEPSGPQDTSVSAVYRHRIAAIYHAKAPKKLGKLDSVMRKYAGDEHEYYMKICLKYGVMPEEQYFDPNAVQEEDKPDKSDPHSVSNIYRGRITLLYEELAPGK